MLAGAGMLHLAAFLLMLRGTESVSTYFYGFTWWTYIVFLSGVKQLVLFHHTPSYDEAKLDQIAEEASWEFENVACARAGDSVIL